MKSKSGRLFFLFNESFRAIHPFIRFRSIMLVFWGLMPAVHVQAQNDAIPWLDIGSPAPPLKVREWLKGKPITAFEKGNIYVVEFWATWCGPCHEEMPRLSALARKYRRSVKVVGIDIYERKNPAQLKSFVDSMGDNMKYAVAVQDSNFMETSWMDAVGESGIPASFIINAEGKLAWIGYTAYLPDALTKIVHGNWDLPTAKAERIAERHAEKMDGATFKAVEPYASNNYMKDFFGDPDSALFVLNKIMAKDTGVRYQVSTAYSMLHTLLRIDARKALAYGRMLMTGKDPSYDAIIGAIKDYPYQFNSLPKEMFELGAEACQGKMDLFPYSTHTAKNYFFMADWYLRANNKTKARDAMRKAIKALKRKRQFLARDI